MKNKMKEQTFTCYLCNKEITEIEYTKPRAATKHFDKVHPPERQEEVSRATAKQIFG